MADHAPASVVTEIAALDAAMTAADLPIRTANNLLIGTWNLRAFGGLSASWKPKAGASPKRDWRAVALIAEIISRFDVVALQEVKRDTTALRFLLDRLGPQWRFISSDVTEGDAGNDERLAFVYDTERVQPSGLVGEIVLPPQAGTPAKQFARAPYAASFVRNGREFILTSVHVDWADGSAKGRVPELTAFAEWMRDWADRARDWNGNLLVLGDFNIDRDDSPLYFAFASTGLTPPYELNDIPRTIFDGGKDKHFYDQIAWFWQTMPVVETLLDGLDYTTAGSFDFVPHLFPGLTKTEVSWRISDHYPLWVEFGVDSI